MKSRLVDKKRKDFQLKLDYQYHEPLMSLRATSEKSMKVLVQEALNQFYGFVCDSGNSEEKNVL